MEFEDDQLALVLTDRGHETGLGANLIQAVRRKLQFVIAATDERDLRNLKSLHYEKLKGDRAGQRSIRLNKQWRLVFRLDESVTPSKVIIIGVEDYH